MVRRRIIPQPARQLGREGLLGRGETRLRPPAELDVLAKLLDRLVVVVPVASTANRIRQPRQPDLPQRVTAADPQQHDARPRQDNLRDPPASCRRHACPRAGRRPGFRGRLGQIPLLDLDARRRDDLPGARRGILARQPVQPRQDLAVRPPRRVQPLQRRRQPGQLHSLGELLEVGGGRARLGLPVRARKPLVRLREIARLVRPHRPLHRAP